MSSWNSWSRDRSTFFGTQHYLHQRFFWTKIYFGQTFSPLTSLWPILFIQICLNPKSFWGSKFFYPHFFGSNFFYINPYCFVIQHRLKCTWKWILTLALAQLVLGSTPEDYNMQKSKTTNLNSEPSLWTFRGWDICETNWGFLTLFSMGKGGGKKKTWSHLIIFI